MNGMTFKKLAEIYYRNCEKLTYHGYSRKSAWRFPAYTYEFYPGNVYLLIEEGIKDVNAIEDEAYMCFNFTKVIVDKFNDFAKAIEMLKHKIIPEDAVIIVTKGAVEITDELCTKMMQLPNASLQVILCENEEKINYLKERIPNVWEVYRLEA